jgi:carbon storage regulator
MLVLARKTSEWIRVGKDISILVVDIENGAVRLGITAPPEVPILREELIERQRETATA